MGWIKNLIIGLLTISISTTSIFIIMNTLGGDSLLAMNITDESSEFYVKINGDYNLAGRELSELVKTEVITETLFDNETNETYNNTYSISTILNSTNNISYIEGDMNFTAIRNQQYENSLIKETYFYDGDNTDVNLFPIFHKIEIYNASGFIYRYIADNLDYNGPTVYNLNHLVIVGKNISIEWENEYPIYQELNSNGTLILDFNITEDYEDLYIRLFDPITVLSITAPQYDGDYIHQFNNVAFSITNTTAIDKCWYNMNDSINITIYPCTAGTNYIPKINTYGVVNVLNLYVNDTSGNINTTTRIFKVENSFANLEYIDSTWIGQNTFSAESYTEDSAFFGGGAAVLRLYNFSNNSYRVINAIVVATQASVNLIYDSNYNLLYHNTKKQFGFTNLSNNNITYLTNTDVGDFFGSVIVTPAVTYLNGNFTLFYASNKLGKFNLSGNTTTQVTYGNSSGFNIVGIKKTSETDIYILTTSASTPYYKLLYFNGTDDTYSEINTSNCAIKSSIQGWTYDYKEGFYIMNSGGNYDTYLCYYNTTDNTARNITGYNTSKVMRGGIAYINGSNLLYVAGSTFILSVINLTDNSTYLISNALKTVGGTTFQIGVYDYKTNLYYIASNGGTKGVLTIPLFNKNATNRITTNLLNNNSYINSVDPINYQVKQNEYISDCFMNYNGTNFSLLNYGCNLTTVINNNLFNKLNLGTINNITLYANNTNNVLNTIIFENVTIANSLNTNEDIPTNAYLAVSNQICKIDRKIWYFNSNVHGGYGYYDLDLNSYIDLSQNDIDYNISSSLSTYTTCLYHPRLNILLLGAGATKLAYINLSESDYRVHQLLTNITLGTTNTLSMELDGNDDTMLYIGKGNTNTFSRMFRINLTSGGAQDISLLDSSNYKGNQNINVIKWYNISGASYFYMLGQGATGNVMRFNVTSGTFTSFAATRNFYSDYAEYDGVIYVGGSAYLAYLNESTGVLTDITSSAGTLLTGKIVYGIYNFNDTDIFVSTNLGLFKYNIQNNVSTYMNQTNYGFNAYSRNVAHNLIYDNTTNRIYDVGNDVANKLWYYDLGNQPMNIQFGNGFNNNSYTGKNQYMAARFSGNNIDSCWYNLNDDGNISLTTNCTNYQYNYFTPNLTLGINNITIYMNDTNGNILSKFKRFKVINFTEYSLSTISSSNKPVKLYYDNVTKLEYVGMSGGTFGYINTTNKTVVSLSSTDTGNWVSTGTVNSFCRNDDGMIYIGVGATVVGFGYYNLTSNVATNLTRTVTGLNFTTNFINSVECYNDSILIGTKLTPFIFRYYLNGTVINLTVTGQVNNLKLDKTNNILYFVSDAVSSLDNFGFVNLTDNTVTYLNQSILYQFGASTFGDVITDSSNNYYFIQRNILKYNGTLSLLNQSIDKQFLNINTQNTMYGTIVGDRLFTQTRTQGFNSGYHNLASGLNYPFYNSYSNVVTSATIYSINSYDSVVHYGAIRKLIELNTSILIDEISFGPSDSCTYSSGNFTIQCVDGCNLTAIYNLGNNYLKFNGTGTVTITGNITTNQSPMAQGGCQIYLRNGGRISK